MKKILDQINLPAKFLLLGSFALVLFILPTFLFIQTGNQLIDTKKVELTGIPVEKKFFSYLTCYSVIGLKAQSQLARTNQITRRVWH